MATLLTITAYDPDSGYQWVNNRDSSWLLPLYTDNTFKTCMDASAFGAITLTVKNSAGTVVSTKTLTSGLSVTGTFNANPMLNAQRIVVSWAAADMSAQPAGWYTFELARTDAGNSVTLADGKAYLNVF